MTNKSTIGATMLAATAASVAAGYYFYASKHAKKNRKIVANWAVNLKNDVIKEAKGVKNLDRKAILGVIDQAVLTYENVRDLRRDDLERAARELKENWQHIAQELNKGRPSGIRAMKRTVRSARKSASR